MLDPLYNGMGIRARVCVSPLSSYLYIISMNFSAHTRKSYPDEFSIFGCKFAAKYPSLFSAVHSCQVPT